MATTISESEKFKKAFKPKPAGRPIAIAGSIPGERAAKGETINVAVKARDSNHEQMITLVKKIAEGGEGAVFTTNRIGWVAKIYKREKLTTDRRDKLQIMIGKPIGAQCKGVCFPVACIYNERDEFVGYLMPQAKGIELQKSVFQPKLLHQKFPGWTRKDTIQLCITILEKIQFLNERRVILGDINPLNILVVSPKEVYFVDCDSYQIEGYPCPVGTSNFTPPEAQGKDYKTFLRTKQMENFAVATLLFMIMLPGKAPYSSVGGETPEKNIRNGNFPYPHSDEDGKNVPKGSWGFIWSHMSYRVREAFFETFHKGEAHFAPANRYYPDDWIDLFKKYQHGSQYMLQNDPMAMDIFPTRLKMRECKRDGCTNRYVPDPDNYSPYCEKHRMGTQQQATNSSIASTGARGILPQRRTVATARTSIPRGKKLCPICKTRVIPNGNDYCDLCKEQTVAYRKCVNCNAEFPISRGLQAWEGRTGFKRNQCDICKAAGCTSHPCRHATQAKASQVPASKTIAQGAPVSSSNNVSKPNTINTIKRIAKVIGIALLFFWLLIGPITGGVVGCIVNSSSTSGSALQSPAVSLALIVGAIIAILLGVFITKDD